MECSSHFWGGFRAQVNHDTLSLGVDPLHDLDLMVSFVDVGLIDTHRIDPEKSFLPQKPEISQGGLTIFGNNQGFGSAAENALAKKWIAPSVRDCFICGVVVEIDVDYFATNVFYSGSREEPQQANPGG